MGCGGVDPDTEGAPLHKRNELLPGAAPDVERPLDIKVGDGSRRRLRSRGVAEKAIPLREQIRLVLTHAGRERSLAHLNNRRTALMMCCSRKAPIRRPRQRQTGRKVGTQSSRATAREWSSRATLAEPPNGLSEGRNAHAALYFPVTSVADGTHRRAKCSAAPRAKRTDRLGATCRSPARDTSEIGFPIGF
jgi:hypothetical protein